MLRHRIDDSRPVLISGSVTRDLSRMTGDPFHKPAMQLAERTGNAAYLRLADPHEGARIEAPARGVYCFIEAWSAEYCPLQRLATTNAGEPLLTTWLPIDWFWQMLSHGKGRPAIDAFAGRVEGWRSLDLDEVYFDFYELPE